MFELNFEVRDYECDMQGIVNNSVYLNYLEHTRHKFLQSRNLDFKNITASGVNLVVARMDIRYKKPLKSGDVFTSILQIQSLNTVKIIFTQQLLTDDICLNGTITVVATDTTGKIIKIPQNILRKF